MDNDIVGLDAREIMPGGPDRVVVDPSGEAVPSRRAREEYGVQPDVIFIRDDHWTLGAPESLEDVARDMWAGEWAGLIRRPSFTIQPV